MITEERKTLLLKIIEQTGYIKVEKLAEKIYTSSSTVRRNLAELERLGLVKRSYGGVELSQSGAVSPVRLRYLKNHTEKQQIAKRAAEHLRDNTTIFIDASSTCLHIVPYLEKHRNITVYTNSLEVCSLLSESDIAVYIVGGRLIARSLAFAGEYATDMIQKLYFDALFFSSGGYARELITDYAEQEAHLRRLLLEHSKEKYLLCDSSKLGKEYPHIICSARDLTEIIVDHR